MSPIGVNALFSVINYILFNPIQKLLISCLGNNKEMIRVQDAVYASNLLFKDSKSSLLQGNIYKCPIVIRFIPQMLMNDGNTISITTYIYNRIRISSNCVELIFGKGHLSTLGASRDAVFWFFFLPNVSTLGVFFSDSRRSQSRKMTLSKDKYI